MKCYTVKKTVTAGAAAPAIEILHNTVYSNEADAIAAMESDRASNTTPMSNVIEWSKTETTVKTNDATIAYAIEEHDYADGKMG